MPPPNWQAAPVAPPPGWQPQPVRPPRVSRFATGRKEWIFSLFSMICCLLICNFTFFGDFNLGFSIAVGSYIIGATIYQLTSGGRLTFYSAALLLLSLIISAGFARSDQGFLKFLMVILMFVSVNLGLCATAGQTRFQLGSIRSIGDVFRTLFIMGYGQIGRAFGGLFGGMKGKGSFGKKIGAVLIGLLVMLPLLGIVLPLLIEADAAFEAMMEILPDIDLAEAIVTVIFGTGIFTFLYSRNVALVHHPKSPEAAPTSIKGINKLTINTVLAGVCVVYLLYLFSQLAYFISGFAGIVPRGYTLAEYARRGFFEMTWLCVINMGIIVLASLLTRKYGTRVPLSTRLLCLFIGLVTVFMVAVASAKMAVYIGGYGLTRQRVMTELVILFFGVAALTVSINLFMKKPRYMQVIIITALLLGGTAFWADVDTVVATYNVNAYLDGDLETVDVEYLGELSSGAIPQIARLINDDDPMVAKEARRILRRSDADWEDFREWNYARGEAKKSLTKNRRHYEDEDDFYKDYGSIRFYSDYYSDYFGDY